MNHRHPERRTVRGGLLCASLPGAARSEEPITLRYGQNAAGANGLSSLPLTVAQRKNFFVREGINLVVVPIPGGTDRIVAALDKGEIDAGKNATPYLIQAVLKGSDAVAIMSQTSNPIYSLIARPEIKSFADLKGTHARPLDAWRHHHLVEPAAARPRASQDDGLHHQGRGRLDGALRLPEIGRMRRRADGPARGPRRHQPRLPAARLHLRGGRRSLLQRRHDAARLGDAAQGHAGALRARHGGPPTPS